MDGLLDIHIEKVEMPLWNNMGISAFHTFFMAKWGGNNAGTSVDKPAQEERSDLLSNTGHHFTYLINTPSIIQ